jgi:hypothetical protein
VGGGVDGPSMSSFLPVFRDMIGIPSKIMGSWSSKASILLLALVIR